jgi:hypothetical protein
VWGIPPELGTAVTAMEIFPQAVLEVTPTLVMGLTTLQTAITTLAMATLAMPTMLTMLKIKLVAPVLHLHVLGIVALVRGMYRLAMEPLLVFAHMDRIPLVMVTTTILRKMLTLRITTLVTN